MKIYYQTFGQGEITKFEQGDWRDLSLAEDVLLIPGQFKACPLGIRMFLPKGFEAILALRSSVGKLHQVIMYNAPGVIDNSYKGPNDKWHALLYAPQGAEIKAGERIAQFRIQPKMEAGILVKIKWFFTRKVKFIKTILPETEDRGGLGSTGRRNAV